GQFADIAFPVFARSAALVAEATQVRTLVVTDILETGNVYAVCATAVDVFVVEAFEHAGSAVVERMIHHVVPQLAAATAQAALPNIGCGVHQYPGAIEGRSIEEDHFSEIVIGLVVFSIEHRDAAGASGVFVVNNVDDNRPRPQREVARFYGGGERG